MFTSRKWLTVAIFLKWQDRSVAIMDYHGLSQTITDFHRLSWTVMDFLDYHGGFFATLVRYRLMDIDTC